MTLFRKYTVTARKLLSLILLCCTTAAAAQQAETTAPDALVRNVTGEVLQIIRSDKDIQSGNNRKAIELIETRVLPHFNFAHMTQLAVGRDWKSATPAQQKLLADEFHTLLVRTYSKALTEYRNQPIEVKPLKMTGSETDVKVRTLLNPASGKAIPLDYYLEKQPSGWRVYDIEVDGISLVVNYRESFAAEVRAAGIDGLIKSLQTKNKSGSGGDRK